MSADNVYVKILAVLVTSLIVIGVILYLYPSWYMPTLFRLKYKVFNSKPKMLIVWRHGLGERELGARIMMVMPKLGVNVKFVSAMVGKHESIYDHYVPNKPEAAAESMQPDFILTIDRAVAPLTQAPNFVVLDQGVTTYITTDQNNNMVFIKPYHYKFTGLLPAFKEIDLLKKVYEANGKPYKGFIWRPTCHRTDYKFQGPKRLFYPGGALMDPTRGSDKYRQVFVLLDQTGYLDVYGWPERWQHTPNSLRGFIPIDGVSLLRINNAAGISLILHADEHLHTATPTGRIFESAAANTVMISDKHDFIIEHFGDNVLYIDVDQDAENMFKQIDQHVQWVMEHPVEAQRMAERCHEIFLEKFTLEEQMQRLLDLALDHTTNLSVSSRPSTEGAL